MAIGKSIYRIMDTLRNILIVVFFSTIIVVCFADVAFRYAPWIKSLGWAEEILRYLNVWIILLGASVATKRKAHLSMQYFLHRFFPKHKTMITQIVYVIVLIFLAIMIIFGTQKTIQNIQQQVQAFPITIAWFYLAIPVGCLYMFIDYLIFLIYGEHPFYIPRSNDQ
jgi:TRAP-type C4-dicarboxylate transport system permease small subunit